MSPDDARHGTTAGYEAHRKTGGGYCDPCRKAAAAYEARRRLDQMHGRPRKVSPLGSLRRVRALMRLGWTSDHISEAIGLRSDGTINDLHRQQWIRPATAAAIASAYERMSMQVGPSRQTAAYAERKGWPPPLAWDNPDDPSERPRGVPQVRSDERSPDELDEAVVLRVLAGENLPTTRAEKEEIMRRWIARGGSETSLCNRTGWKTGRYVVAADDTAREAS